MGIYRLISGLGRIAAPLIALVLLLPVSTAQAQSLLTRTPFHDIEPGSAGIGYAARFGQSPYVGVGDIGNAYNDYRYDLVPLYLYEGDYLFAHGTEWGVHLLRPENFTVNLISRYRFDRLQADSSEFLAGMEDRHQTVDVGLAMSLNGGWGRLELSAVTDLLDRHQGEEADLTYLFPWQRGRWTLAPSVSLIYQSASLANYYYGVLSAEALPDRPAYAPGSAINWRVGLNVTYHWLESWHLFANMSYDGLDDVIADSPITERANLFAAYFGISWSLGNAKHVETRKEHTKLWSWRVNTGYTLQDTFSQVLVGNVQPHSDIDTYMVGLTLGRLLKDGKRGDVWGRISINRRLENDFQKDFNEYVAYAMAIGSGYAPWTDREVFRFGFGMGISYAEKVPAIEQYKQNDPGDRSSHWLNYMEAMVDFPFRTLFGKRGTEDCYLGLTLIHRSGIFGRSDLFNATAGGSEMLTGHVECKF